MQRIKNILSARSPRPGDHKCDMTKLYLNTDNSLFNILSQMTKIYPKCRKSSLRDCFLSHFCGNEKIFWANFPNINVSKNVTNLNIWHIFDTFLGNLVFKGVKSCFSFDQFFPIFGISCYLKIIHIGTYSISYVFSMYQKSVKQDKTFLPSAEPHGQQVVRGIREEGGREEGGGRISKKPVSPEPSRHFSKSI